MGIEFTGVIASYPAEGVPVTKLPQEQGRDLKDCPRPALGMACIGDAYACLCGLVTAWENHYDQEANVFLLTLYTPRRMGAAGAVLDHLDLLPFQIVAAVEQDAVVVTFNLTRPKNSELARRLQNPDY